MNAQECYRNVIDHIAPSRDNGRSHLSILALYLCTQLATAALIALTSYRSSLLCTGSPRAMRSEITPSTQALDIMAFFTWLTDPIHDVYHERNGLPVDHEGDKMQLRVQRRRTAFYTLHISISTRRCATWRCSRSNCKPIRNIHTCASAICSRLFTSIYARQNIPGTKSVRLPVVCFTKVPTPARRFLARTVSTVTQERTSTHDEIIVTPWPILRLQDRTFVK